MKLKFTHKTDKFIRSTARFRDNFKLMQFPEFPFIKVILVNTLAMSLLGLAIPLSIQSVINNITSRAMMQPLVILCLVLLFILSFSGLLQVIQTYVVEILKRRIFVRFGLVITERMTHYQDQVFKKSNSLDLINRYFDTLIMQSSMVTFFVEGFGFSLMFIIGFGLLIFYHPYFLIFALAMAAFLVINWLLFGPDGVKAGSPEADKKYGVESWLEELGRVRNLFISENGREFSNQKTVQLFNEWLEKRNNLFNFQFRQHIGLQIFSVMTNVLLLFIGGFLVLEEQLTVGQLVAASLVVSNIVSSLPRLQAFFTSVYDYSTSIDKLAEFYDYPLEEVKPDAVKVNTKNIEFKNVKLPPNYHFNFSIPDHKTNYVYVKSFSAIDHIYDLMIGNIIPADGNVTFNGKFLQDVDLSLLRDRVQLIRYDQYFSGTVMENLVGFSPKQPDMAQIQSILEMVGVWDNIKNLPDKLETIIRPNGFPFSKSQLLSLQLAKAMILRPELILVTPDFEQISTFKRRLCLEILLDNQSPWKVMFFSQKFYSEGFEQYYRLDRQGLQPYENTSELLKEIESNG